MLTIAAALCGSIVLKVLIDTSFSIHYQSAPAAVNQPNLDIMFSFENLPFMCKMNK